MFPHFIFFLLLATYLPLVGCGTTSAFIPVEENLASLEGSNYNNIVVYDFIDKTHKDQKKAQSKRRKKIMGFASQRFADLVALKIEKTGAFEKTTRQTKKQANEEVSLDGDYLALEGEINRYYRGNTFFRVLIGYGIGTAFLDADIGLYDAKTNALIGTFEVDKNSWFLGGVLAITHSIEHFMKGSANKIAEEIAAINHNTVEPVHENASLQTLATLKSNQNDIVLTDTHQLVQ